MNSITRRTCLVGLSATSLLAAVPASASLEGNERLDLVIKGGEVLDPSQSLHAKYDVGIRAGRIAALKPDLPASQADRVLDATGKLIVPTPIDIHAWFHPFGMSSDLAADGITAKNDGFSVLRQQLVGESVSLEQAADFCCRADIHAGMSVLDNAPNKVIGLKVAFSEAVLSEYGLKPLERAIQACEGAGRSARIMVDVGSIDTSGRMSRVLDLLRAGDIVTRCYSDDRVTSTRGASIAPNGRLLAAALAAKQRGVLFDIGRGDFDARVAKAAIAQGAPPDMITPNLQVVSGAVSLLPVLPAAVGRLVDIGLDLEQVVTMATLAPARILGDGTSLGTLQIGAHGDVVVATLTEKTITYTNSNDLFRANVSLRTAQSVRAGLVIG